MPKGKQASGKNYVSKGSGRNVSKKNVKSMRKESKDLTPLQDSRKFDSLMAKVHNENEKIERSMIKKKMKESK